MSCRSDVCYSNLSVVSSTVPYSYVHVLRGTWRKLSYGTSTGRLAGMDARLGIAPYSTQAAHTHNTRHQEGGRGYSYEYEYMGVLVHIIYTRMGLVMGLGLGILNIL